MKPSLQLRLSTQLALTPQLQQSIRLLQLSTLELNQELEHALAENPLLERLDDPFAATVRIAPNGGLEDGRAGATPDAADASGHGEPDEFATPADDAADTAPWDGNDLLAADWGGERATRAEGDERDYPQLAAARPSLREHLVEQLAGLKCIRRDRALVQTLIDALDDDGYLDSSLVEIAALLPAELAVEPEELATALRLLQSLDPVGVGARDLRESLLLQIDRGEAARDQPAGVVRIARAIVDEHLAALAAHDFARLRRLLHCDDETLRAAQALIRRLEPRPGAAFGGGEADYVIPDVVVRRTRNGWVATLNPDVMPRLRVNDAYAQVLKRNRGANGGLAAQLQEARWLVRNLQQRFETIQRVAQAIVDRQKAYFSHGAVAMRPLVLREIADALGLHESTVSRVTTQKYMLTPFGVVELKYFFGSHVATDSGGAASSTAIRALMKQMFAAENPAQPLSDSHVAELLAEQGFVVARRTVAKYREALRIPPVARRRAL
ncbi:MAG: RNA polymerase factor sigma-54 [Lautropia sp.]|nr:MAG: RNA polymerase factor sigma-54 [Pseudomonadota bacterium]MBC6960807.1 RNA polymerase factor sigma-54 [Lautropia sp.]MCL4701761.1 RNA polymerase factor sigma-54 [Burkholderiaceae bacterium]MDL1908781.1 RNA polymerase factor sigma-54 [Betaproteobacteria bacterium PRO1]RIK87715.1 MAG: RNA polymerase factor sigma-54 [Burkholderiales bacterium]